jgi:hypothetical protein
MLLDVYGNVFDYTTDTSVYGRVFRFSSLIPVALIRRAPTAAEAVVRRGPSSGTDVIRRG